jgi:DNA ligase-1
MKALWVPSSRGVDSAKVPWSIDKKDRVSTGLFSRYGNHIAAPDWFLDMLPPFSIVGELWLGTGQFQELISITRSETPDTRWEDLKFMVFDSPKRFGDEIKPTHFYEVYDYLLHEVRETANLKVVGQQKLPLKKTEFCSVIETEMERALAQGHEGLMIRDPIGRWEAKRSSSILKYKPWYDDEAKVIHTFKGEGKYAGMIGSIQCYWKNKFFDIGTGLDDSERSLPPEAFVGKTITFRYRELTKDGIPKEARFLRFRNPV